MKITTYRRKQNKSYKIALLIAVLLVTAGTLVGLYRYFQTGINKISQDSTVVPEPEVIKNTSKKQALSAVLPSNVNLAVPYGAQAPFGNWTVHEESCEEAATLMYHEFLLGTKYAGNRIPDAVDDPIYRDMKSWQVTHYGSEPDLTMEALGKFAKDYYGFSYKTADASEANIKSALASGSPVVVPVMTHSLENSMYGPVTVYHVLLIKGYDATGVITNDAGVGNGPDHHYDWNILWQAIDAQTPKMGQGRVMLTISK